MFKHIKKIVGFLFVLFLGYQIVGCSHSSTNVQEGKVCGIIVEDGNVSQTIQNAEVKIIENNVAILTLNTDEKGSYCFDPADVSEDTFFIKVLKDNYANGFVEVNSTNLSKIDDIPLTKLNTTISVPKSGKTIELDNNTSLIFPSDAADDDIVVQATPTQMYQTISVDTNNTLFYSIDLVAKEVSTGEEIHNFNKPIELSIPITIDGNISADNFEVYRLNEETNTLILEDVNKTLENGYLKIYLKHFSHHAVKFNPRDCVSSCYYDTTELSSKPQRFILESGKIYTAIQPACTYAKLCGLSCEPSGGGGVFMTILKRGKIVTCCDGKKYCNLKLPKGCKKVAKKCPCKPTKIDYCPMTGKPTCTQEKTKTCPDGTKLTWCPEKNEPVCPPPPPSGGTGGTN